MSIRVSKQNKKPKLDYIPQGLLRDYECLLLDCVLEFREFLGNLSDEENNILRDVLRVDCEKRLEERENVHRIRRVLGEFIRDGSNDFFQEGFHRGFRRCEVHEFAVVILINAEEQNVEVLLHFAWTPHESVRHWFQWSSTCSTTSIPTSESISTTRTTCSFVVRAATTTTRTTATCSFKQLIEGNPSETTLV